MHQTQNLIIYNQRKYHQRQVESLRLNLASPSKDTRKKTVKRNENESLTVENFNFEQIMRRTTEQKKIVRQRKKYEHIRAIHTNKGSN